MSATQSLVSVLPSNSASDLRGMQEDDPLLKEVLFLWHRGSLPTSAERRHLSHLATAL